MVSATGDIFIDLGVVIIIAAAAAFILRVLKQPQILAYVLVGILITPVFAIITDTSIIESMSIIGIAFLLFLVGLEMDIKALKNVALVSGFGGFTQIALTFVLGYFISLLLGFLTTEAAYVGLMLAFSSTMVVMKLLSDRRELNTLHGRLIVGILLMQDIVAIFALSVLTSINEFSVALLGMALLKFLFLFFVAFFLSKYVFPSIFHFAARHQELLLVTSLAVCFIFSLGFFYLGFSVAIGAFIAGVALGNLDYNLEIIGKVKSLRDFFSLLFFVSLGMGLSLAAVKRLWVPMVILLLVILVVKPFIVMIICSLFRYTKKPSFLTAISLAQVGEFSLILAAQGLVLGHISPDLFSLVVIITLISITMTPYLIQYSYFVYRIMERPLSPFDSFNAEGLEYLPTETKPRIVLCGHNRIGYSILRGLKDVKRKVLVVDYNPEVIPHIIRQGYHSIYGDVTDEEIIERMNLEHISLLISTIPEISDNLFLINKVRHVNRRAQVIVTAMDTDDALLLYNHGADYVILPHFLGGEHVSQLITNVRKKKAKLGEERKVQIALLHERKRQGRDLPDE